MPVPDAPPRSPHRRRGLAALAGLLVLLAGCAGGFGGLFGPRLSPALEAQRARLADALRGTPVVIEATAERRLRIEVPARHAFEPGRTAVKPALGAVLEQFAIGFRPHAASTELQIGAPDEAGAEPRLAKERALNAREYLIGRGVPASRITVLGRAPRAGLELLVGDRAPNAR